MSAAYRTAPDSLDAIRADLDVLLATSPAAFAMCNPARLAEAQDRFARRALSTAAEHGIALLAALDVPFPVGDDFVPLDPVAIGEAVEAAVAALDALDGDADLEPDLGWTGAAFNRADRGDAFDREDDSEEDEDGGDREPSLASPENHGSQLQWAAGADLDREGDDAEHDDDRTAEHSALRVWVFGPSRREAAHV